MTQRWAPDTCGCVVDESYATGSRVYVGTVAVCPAHAPLAGTVAHLDVLVKENRAKNVAVNAAAEVLAESVSLMPIEGAAPSRVTDNGDGSFSLSYAAAQLAKQWLPDKVPSFSYENGVPADKRKLVLQVSGDAQQAQLVADKIAQQAVSGISEIVVKAKP